MKTIIAICTAALFIVGSANIGTNDNSGQNTPDIKVNCTLDYEVEF